MIAKGGSNVDILQVFNFLNFILITKSDFSYIFFIYCEIVKSQYSLLVLLKDMFYIDKNEIYNNYRIFNNFTIY